MNNLPAGNKQIKIRIPDTSILPFGKVIFLSAESKIELRNIFTEMVLEILFIVGELLVFGRLFHWFTSLSFLLLVFMGVVIYIISYFLNLLQMKQEEQYVLSV